MEASFRFNSFLPLSLLLKWIFLPQAEPPNPMYGLPASSTPAAPLTSSTPAYMYSHQYQRKWALERLLGLMKKNQTLLTVYSYKNG